MITLYLKKTNYIQRPIIQTTELFTVKGNHYVSINAYIQKLLIGIIMITIPCILLAFHDSEGSDRMRLLIGLDLFPSFLASDQQIHNKVDIDNKLNVVVAYQYNQQIAEKMAKRLRQLGKIRGIPIKVKIATVNDIEFFEKEIISGVFIAELLISLKPIIDKSIVKQFIVFSPFEGDVEQGVTCGMYIAEKIVPYINTKTLTLSKIKIKNFFLRVSKQYE